MKEYYMYALFCVVTLIVIGYVMVPFLIVWYLKELVKTIREVKHTNRVIGNQLHRVALQNEGLVAISREIADTLKKP